MEGLEDRLGLWLRRMSTAPTTSESMATNKASVACTETKNVFSDIRSATTNFHPVTVICFASCECVDLAAMFQEKLQDVQILVLDGDGDGIPAQHVHAVDVELAVSVLLQQLLHHIVVTWVKKKKKKTHGGIRFRKITAKVGSIEAVRCCLRMAPNKTHTHTNSFFFFLRTRSVLAEAGWAPAVL